MHPSATPGELTAAQKEILKRSRLELSKLVDDPMSRTRFHPLSEEYEIVNDLIATIEDLLGY